MDKLKKTFHKWAWVLLVAFCIAGLFYPLVGIAAVICMLAPVAVSFFKGRLWCGNFCPRGSFNDILISRISRKLHLPGFFKKQWFRLLFLGVLMSFFAIQIIWAWGNLALIGTVFVRMIIITTLLTMFLGTIFNQRAWCKICPMGTLAHYVAKLQPVSSRINHVTFHSDKCIGCKICSNSCPMGIDVLKHKEAGKVSHADCLKCKVCIDKCPKDSLYIA